MENKFIDGMNFCYTENGAITHKTTKSCLFDMFAMGAAMRVRCPEDVVIMWRNAFAENPVYALKCLFYIRDVRGGQGERRFFRICMKDLAKQNPAAAKRNLKYIPMFGRWDDLYVFVGTPLEKDAFSLMKHQLSLDVQCKTPSLLAKWLKSENTSSYESRKLGNLTRRYLGMNHKQYRKTLSILRERISVLEKLMSAGRWDEIEFDKVPSKAGLKYRNAFARHDFERHDAQTYEDFAKDSSTKVNAGALYPYECVEQAFNVMSPYDGWFPIQTEIAWDDPQRLMVNKYWDNLTDYIHKASFNGMAIVDTSGSMRGTPRNVAISLGMYCAEKCTGPFENYFMTFSSYPDLVKVEGIDFCDKVIRMSQSDWDGSTDIGAAFDLILKTAIENKCSQDEIPQNLIIISDMEFDSCVIVENCTLFESMVAKWASFGYKMPRLYFWNVNARQNNIPMKDDGNVSYISGFSPSIFEAILSGKTGSDLMMEKLNSERYSVIK